MNWTGGRLQRHSKANANTQLKTQKQYFARARQRLQNGHAPPSPSAFSILKDQLGSGRDLRSIRPSPQAQAQTQIQSPKQALQKPSGARNNSAIFISSSPCADREQPASQSALDRGQQQVKGERKPDLGKSVPQNPLDSIRQRLLASTDWAGLAPTKPVQMSFNSAQGMERIGRRRTVTTEERKRKKDQATRFRRPHHEIIRPIRHPASQTFHAPLREDDYSIRIGSNIHHTQTTWESLPQQSKLSGPPSKSSESMLLDRFDAVMQDESSASNIVGDSNTLQDNAERSKRGQRLVPLNEALDLQSWDEVLERSSSRSLVQAKAPSSTPFVDRSPSKPNTFNRSAKQQDRWNLNPHLTYSPKDVKERAYLMQQSTGEHLANNVEVSQGLFDVGRLSCLNGEVLPERSRKRGSLVKNEAIREPNALKLGSHPPRFTLEDQVRVEQQLSDRGTNLLRRPSEGSAASTKPGVGASHPLWTQATVDAPMMGGHSGSPAYAPSASQLRGATVLKADQAQPLTWMERFQRAKSQHQEGTERRPASNDDQSCGLSRLADDNEAWMKYVFPKDFDRIQNDFAFAHPIKASQRLNPLSPISPMTPVDNSAMEKVYTCDSAKSSLDGAASHREAPTNFNATIFDPSWKPVEALQDPAQASEIDFLSRYSPMAGVIDEASGNVSTYTNPARSHRTILTQPESASPYPSHFNRGPLVPKRTAEQAFSEVTASPHNSQRSLQHRQPLRSMAQPCLWNANDPYASTGVTSHLTSGTDIRAPTHHSHREAMSRDSRVETDSRRNNAAAFALAYSPLSSSSHKSKTRRHQTPSFVSQQATDSRSAPSMASMKRSSFNHIDSNKADAGVGAQPANIYMNPSQPRQPSTPLFGETQVQKEHMRGLHTPPILSQSELSPPLACRSALQGFKMLHIPS